MRTIGWTVFLSVTLVLLWPMSSRASEFPRLLELAEAARNKRPAEFAELIAKMRALQERATPEEQLHLRLLQNYQSTLIGNYQAAIGDSVALFDQAPDATLKYRSAMLVANVSAINRDYLFGLRYLEKALALQDQLVDRDLRASGDITAGTLFNEFGHFDLALGHAERVLANAPSDRNRCIARQIRVRALHGLRRALDENGDAHEAIADCVNQSEAIAVNAIRSTLAEYWAGNGKSMQAIALLEASLPEAIATGYSRLIGEIEGQLARLKLEAGDAAAAEMHARSVVQRPGQDPLSLANVTAEHVLYQTALSRGDSKAALHHYRRYAEADKARMDDIKAREYAFQLSRHEIAQKNQSIELLSSQNQLLKLQQDVSEKDAWNSRLAIALLAVVALSLGFWGLRGRRMHRTMQQLAQTDSLTGLSNRRHYRERSEEVLAQSAVRGRPVSVLLFDLDHFKQINDQCGHASGDWVLREVARVGRLLCREGDLFGRIGGEEFALTLIDCDVTNALEIAEDYRKAIARIDGSAAGCTLPVTASVGCVGTSMSGYNYELLIAHADAAMYHSKVGGRNRVTLYERGPRRVEEPEKAGYREVKALLAQH